MLNIVQNLDLISILIATIRSQMDQQLTSFKRVSVSQPYLHTIHIISNGPSVRHEAKVPRLSTPIFISYNDLSVRHGAKVSLFPTPIFIPYTSTAMVLLLDMKQQCLCFPPINSNGPSVRHETNVSVFHPYLHTIHFNGNCPSVRHSVTCYLLIVSDADGAMTPILDITVKAIWQLIITKIT